MSNVISDVRLYFCQNTKKGMSILCADVGRDDDRGVNLSHADEGNDVVGFRALTLNPSELETWGNWLNCTQT